MSIKNYKINQKNIDNYIIVHYKWKPKYFEIPFWYTIIVSKRLNDCRELLKVENDTGS